MKDFLLGDIDQVSWRRARSDPRLLVSTGGLRVGDVAYIPEIGGEWPPEVRGVWMVVTGVITQIDRTDESDDDIIGCAVMCPRFPLEGHFFGDIGHEKYPVKRSA